jgi:hypothetical protein
VFDGLHDVRFSNEDQGKYHNWRQLFALIGPSLQGFFTSVVYMIFHREKRVSFANNVVRAGGDNSSMMDIALVDSDETCRISENQC